jgi:molecular chaperone GrpE
VVDKESKGIRIPVNSKAEDAERKDDANSRAHSDTRMTQSAEDDKEGTSDVPETVEERLKRKCSEVRENPERYVKADEVIRAVSEASNAPSAAWVENRAHTVDLLLNLAHEAYENHDRWVRSVAELENFKKRTAQERSKLIKYGNEHLLRDLLTIVDNVERAIEAAEKAGEQGPFVDGVKMIAQMFFEILTRHGANPVHALGEPFDPNLHEAVTLAPTVDAAPNTVLEQLEKGYTYHDRLLRPSKVVVSADMKKDE